MCDSKNILWSDEQRFGVNCEAVVDQVIVVQNPCGACSVFLGEIFFVCCDRSPSELSVPSAFQELGCQRLVSLKRHHFDGDGCRHEPDEPSSWMIRMQHSSDGCTSF